MIKFFRFPNPVNEVASQGVACGVALMCSLVLSFSQPWFVVPLVLGFAIRVSVGPRFSPLALFVAKILTNVPERLVPGPPKRFAQAMGLVMSASAAVAFILGASPVGHTLIAALYVAAMLEGVIGLCLGCKAFGLLMRLGVIPEKVCYECSNFGSRLDPAA